MFTDHTKSVSDRSAILLISCWPSNAIGVTRHFYLTVKDSDQYFAGSCVIILQIMTNIVQITISIKYTSFRLACLHLTLANSKDYWLQICWKQWKIRKILLLQLNRKWSIWTVFFSSNKYIIKIKIYMACVKTVNRSDLIYSPARNTQFTSLLG